MKKILSAFVIGLVPALAFANDAVDPAELTLPRSESRPVVSVIALSAEQAAEFARVRSEYRAGKIELEAEYEALLDAVLAKPRNSEAI